MNKLYAVLMLLSISTLLSNCGMVGYGIKANTTALLTKGDKDVSQNKKYWKYIERGSVLESLNNIEVYKSENPRYDFNADPNSNPNTDGELNMGSSFVLNTVHYKSNGYTIWDTDYIATVLDGAFTGKTIRINNLLQLAEYNSSIMKLNTQILKKRENKSQ